MPGRTADTKVMADDDSAPVSPRLSCSPLIRKGQNLSLYGHIQGSGRLIGNENPGALRKRAMAIKIRCLMRAEKLEGDAG